MAAISWHGVPGPVPEAVRLRVGSVRSPVKLADVVGALCVLAFFGCASPLAINSAMVNYDKAVLRAENELLLLNILRARDEEPMHFTVMPSIAATFHFQLNGGLGGRMFSTNPNAAYNSNFLSLNLGGEASESPTAQIVPIQGEDFTRRVLMPIDQGRFEFLTNQTSNLSAILRLTVHEVELDSDTKDLHLLRNAPGFREEYAVFRRVVQHLAFLHATKRLYIGPLVFEERIDVPDNERWPMMSLEHLLEGAYRVSRKDGPGYVVTRTVVGRTVIMNLNPAVLSNQEKLELNRRTEPMKSNIIPVVIRPDGPGGDYPLLGHLRLRSFAQIMKFLGNGLGKEPEYEVEPDEKTGIIIGPFGKSTVNPRQTLMVRSGSDLPPSAFVSTVHNGKEYWIDGIRSHSLTEPEATWNMEIFGLLYQIFQLNVSEGTQTRGLPITIAK
jgi:hypothetical protein